MSYAVDFWALPQPVAGELARQAAGDAGAFAEAVAETGVLFGSIGHSSSGGAAFRDSLTRWGERTGLPLSQWLIGPNPDLAFPAPIDLESGYPASSGFTADQAALLVGRLEAAMQEFEITDEDADIEEVLSVAMDARDRGTDITTVYG